MIKKTPHSEKLWGASLFMVNMKEQLPGDSDGCFGQSAKGELQGEKAERRLGEPLYKKSFRTLALFSSLYIRANRPNNDQCQQNAEGDVCAEHGLLPSGCDGDDLRSPRQSDAASGRQRPA